MAKPRRTIVRRADEPQPLVIDNNIREQATGVADPDLGLTLLNQLLRALWAPSSMACDLRVETVKAAIAALSGLAPQDTIEGMLGVQMVATHNAAMECLRRAAHEHESTEGRDLNLRHASKLLGIYTRQMEALDKRRGKGVQYMVVRHERGDAPLIEQSVETKASGADPSRSMREQERAAPHLALTDPRLRQAPPDELPAGDRESLEPVEFRPRLESRRKGLRNAG